MLHRVAQPVWFLMPSPVRSYQFDKVPGQPVPRPHPMRSAEMTGGLRWEPLPQWSRRYILYSLPHVNTFFFHLLGNGVLTRTQIWIGGIEPGPALRPSPFRVPLLKPGMVWLHGMRVLLIRPRKMHAVFRHPASLHPLVHLFATHQISQPSKKAPFVLR